MSDTPKTDELANREFVPDGLWIRHARQLERENAALKAALDHQMNYQRELRADRDRLDWLDKTGCWLTITGQKNFISGSARAVIDAAMGEGKQ